MKLYLSPSNQPHNTYSGVKTNEKAEMEAVAQRVKTLLEKNYVVEVVMATLSMGINKSERPTECKNKGCDFYLAIHSNAGGAGKASGAVGFYHPDGKNAKALATALVKELNAICPYKSNRSSPVQSGMTQFDGAGYGEIRSPMQLGVPSALVEVDFHDNEPIAKWIVNNKDAIAGAIVKAIADTFNLQKKTTGNAGTGSTETPVNTSGTYKVGDIVNYKGTKHYTSANATAAKTCKGGKAKITAIYQLGKSKHPYHLIAVDGSGSTVYGWVDASAIEGAATVPTPYVPAVGDIVNYKGTKHYTSANATAAKTCKGGKAKITAIYRPDYAKHPYHLIRVSGSGATVYGWVDGGTFTKV